jgi:hypothetical protein
MTRFHRTQKELPIGAENQLGIVENFDSRVDFMKSG